MSLPVALLLTLLVALPAHAGVLSRKVTFLGYSANEAVSAWQTDTVEREGQGAPISRRVIRMIRTADNTVVATLSPSQWQGYRKQVGVKPVSLDMQNTTVRLAPDPDTSANIMMAHKKCIMIQTKRAGEPVGFQPVALLLNGDLMSLGHFRIEGQPGQHVRGCVEAKMAPSGFTVAIVAHLETQQEGSTRWVPRPMGAVTALPEAMGTQQLGTLQLRNAHERLLRKVFTDIHPNSVALYDQIMN